MKFSMLFLNFLAVLMNLFMFTTPTQAAQSNVTTEKAMERNNQAWASAKAIERAFDQGKGWDQLGTALDALVRTSVRALRDVGQFGEAQLVRDQWPLYQARYFAEGLTPEDLGDHAPLSEWLVRLYDQLDTLLGPTNMKLMHLTDIKVINFAIPVVFHGKATEHWCFENQIQHPRDTCKAEYRRHFAGTQWQRDTDPFAMKPLHDGLIPVIAYWIVWGACEAVTYGTGYVVVCAPAATLVEIITARYVAPPLSDKCFDRANQ